jgi:hypothetical protein
VSAPAITSAGRHGPEPVRKKRAPENAAGSSAVRSPSQGTYFRDKFWRLQSPRSQSRDHGHRAQDPGDGVRPRLVSIVTWDTSLEPWTPPGRSKSCPSTGTHGLRFALSNRWLDSAFMAAAVTSQAPIVFFVSSHAVGEIRSAFYSRSVWRSMSPAHGELRGMERQSLGRLSRAASMQTALPSHLVALGHRWGPQLRDRYSFRDSFPLSGIKVTRVSPHRPQNAREPSRHRDDRCGARDGRRRAAPARARRHSHVATARSTRRRHQQRAFDWSAVMPPSLALPNRLSRDETEVGGTAPGPANRPASSAVA